MTDILEMELEELHDTLHYLEAKRDSFFGTEQVHTGDQGYQDILQSIDACNERIAEIEKGYDAEVDVSPLFKPCGAKLVKKLLRSLGFHHSWGYFIQNGNGQNRVQVMKNYIMVTKHGINWNHADNIQFRTKANDITLGQVQAKLMTYFDIDEIPQIDDKYKQ